MSSGGMDFHSLGRVVDHREFDDVSRRIAAGFAELGVGDGDAVGLLMVNENCLLYTSDAADD